MPCCPVHRLINIRSDIFSSRCVVYNAAWTNICNLLLCRSQHPASDPRYACCTILLGTSTACLPSSDVPTLWCMLVIMCKHQDVMYEHAFVAAWHLCKAFFRYKQVLQYRQMMFIHKKGSQSLHAYRVLQKSVVHDHAFVTAWHLCKAHFKYKQTLQCRHIWC